MNYYTSLIFLLTDLCLITLFPKEKALIEIYPTNLKEEFVSKFLLFLSWFSEKKTETELLAAQIEKEFNVYIASRNYLTFFGRV